MRKPRITVASAKAKGRNLQIWVRDKLRSLLQGIEDDDVTSTPMGVNGPDVGLSPLARRLFPWTVECKARKSFSIYKAMEQAESNMMKDTRPVVIIRGDRKTPLAVIHAEHFMELTCPKKK